MFVLIVMISSRMQQCNSAPAEVLLVVILIAIGWHLEIQNLVL